MHDLICYQFSRDRVGAGDAKDFLSRVGKFRVPVGKQLQGMMNSLALMIEGYDDDPREIYAIPEVRTFYQQGSMCPSTGPFAEVRSVTPNVHCECSKHQCAVPE